MSRRGRVLTLDLVVELVLAAGGSQDAAPARRRVSEKNPATPEASQLVDSKTKQELNCNATDPKKTMKELNIHEWLDHTQDFWVRRRPQ